MWLTIKFTSTCAYIYATPWTVARQAPLTMVILQARILEWVAMPSPPGDLPNPGIQPRSPTLKVDGFLTIWATPGKPMNTGMGGLSLLHGIFLTKELNWGLLHCRSTLYTTELPGSPYMACISVLLHSPGESSGYKSKFWNHTALVLA